MPAINDLTQRIIGAAIHVHRQLGPGLFESAYEACLAEELESRSISFQRQLEVPLIYNGKRIGAGYRLDLLVEDTVVVELKSVTALEPVFTKQVLTYLRLGSWPVGLLINFDVGYLGEGAIRRLVHNYRGPRPRASADR